VVREGMIRTVHGPGGTARAISHGIPYLIAGKTGTAQVISRRGSASLDPRSLPMHLRHRALFIGYAPAENPTIALAVVVEGGGYGGSTAAPIARKIFDAWLLGKMPEAPEKPATPAPVASQVEAAPAVTATPSAPTAPQSSAASQRKPAAPPVAPAAQLPRTPPTP
jgi:penicillin-binding protein 2